MSFIKSISSVFSQVVKPILLNKEDEAKFLYIAQNHPNDRLARRAAELIGVELENID